MKNMLFLMFLAILAQSLTLGQSKTLSINNAVEIALEKNTTVIQSQTNVDAAQGKVLAAYGNYLPTLTASGLWNRAQLDQSAGYRNGVPQPSFYGVTNSFSTSLDLNYTIFDGLNRESGFNSAQSAAQSSEDRFIRTRQMITNSVENAYLNFFRLEQLVKVSEENLKREDRQLERITESNKVGAVALADVYRQQSQVAADELSLITAQNNYNKSKADLVSLIGLEMTDDYQFYDASITTAIDSAEMDSTGTKYSNLKDLNQRALAARPDYNAAKEDLSSAQSGVSQARSGYLPTVGASLGYSMSDNELSSIVNNKNTSWGINIRWNLFDAFRTNQSMQSAIAGRRSAEVALLQTERDISVQVKKAMLDLEAARKQVDVSKKGLTSASEDRRIAEERYNLGAGTLLDLLTANAALVNAQANDINAKYNYITAKRNMEYVIGERTY